MRNFLKTLLAVIFGNMIFFGIFFLLMIGLAVGLAMSAKKGKEEVKGDHILTLNIRSGLSDLSQDRSFDFSMSQGNQSAISIYDIIDGIKKAKEDKSIKALWLQMNYNEELSYAQVDLLRHAIADFKTSKKPVVAYGEAISQKMYYLGSASDKVMVNPQGALDVRGFAAQLTFFKKTLDKLEIKPQIFYAGKFKSATEPFRLEKMSEENKVQMKALLSDISNVVLSNIAHDRKLSLDVLNLAINEMRTSMPEDAFNGGLIDKIAYQDEAEGELKKLLKLGEKSEIKKMSMSSYLDDKFPSMKSEGIAVYVADGDIVDGKAEDGSIGSENMVKDIRAMAKDEGIKAVVLRVNSPGGSALASDVILRELELLKKKKPIIVSMGNVAASGGYYIASGAEKIFAEKNTITGSIGVFGIIPNIGQMMENKLGVTFDEVELHEHAAMGINKNFDALEASKIQQAIDKIYLSFKSVVAKGRKLNLDSVENIAQGRVWSGARAKELKLVDEIGGLKEAIAYTAKSNSLEATNYFFYNKRKSEFAMLIEEFSSEDAKSSIEEKYFKSKLGSYAKYYDMLKSFESIRGAQMRMVYQINGL
ncbi:MAG: signal peptide peptidase SppA [Chitinophagales bacterium]|jgi:protease-4|nr:signal peptide peptidase SppA [Sphingobacteriales bacterium]